MTTKCSKDRSFWAFTVSQAAGPGQRAVKRRSRSFALTVGESNAQSNMHVNKPLWEIIPCCADSRGRGLRGTAGGRDKWEDQPPSAAGRTCRGANSPGKGTPVPLLVSGSAEGTTGRSQRQQAWPSWAPDARAVRAAPSSPASLQRPPPSPPTLTGLTAAHHHAHVRAELHEVTRKTRHLSSSEFTGPAPVLETSIAGITSSLRVGARESWKRDAKVWDVAALRRLIQPAVIAPFSGGNSWHHVFFSGRGRREQGGQEQREMHPHLVGLVMEQVTTLWALQDRSLCLTLWLEHLIKYIFCRR